MSPADEQKVISKKRKAGDLSSGDAQDSTQEDVLLPEEKKGKEDTSSVAEDEEMGEKKKESEDDKEGVISEEKKEETGDKMEVDTDGNGDTEQKKSKSDEKREDETKKAAEVDAEEKPEKVDVKKTQSSQNPYEALRWITVTNDGKPASLIKLVALKSLFAKQLPKMPRPYIARLVFDRRHTSLAILSDDPALKDTDEEVIGSICYRAFPEMRFAEIAFCAVNASHQVKVCEKLWMS